MDSSFIRSEILEATQTLIKFSKQVGGLTSNNKFRSISVFALRVGAHNHTTALNSLLELIDSDLDINFEALQSVLPCRSDAFVECNKLVELFLRERKSYSAFSFRNRSDREDLKKAMYGFGDKLDSSYMRLNHIIEDFKL